MDAASSRELIAAKLREALAKGLPKRVHHCRPDPYAPPGAFILPVSRLDLILSGSKRVELKLSSGARQIELKPGDSYMAPPGAWEKYAWDSVGEMLCVVPQKRFLRVSYYAQTDASIKPQATYFHTARLCPPPLLAVVSLLNQERVCEGNPEAALSLARALLCFALEECLAPAAPAKGRGAELFERMRDWLDDRFQEDVSTEDLGRAFSISADYAMKLFKRHSGAGPHSYLSAVRMELARYLLESSEMDVKRVASQCGFKGSAHFTRRFRELHGAPPLRYRLSCKSRENACAEGDEAPS